MRRSDTPQENRASKAGSAPAPVVAGRRPTILDVAEACGVSPATVSNVLANKRHIAAETRALVHAKVTELGYRASAAARGFRLQRSWSVGLVVGDIANPFNPEVVRGVEDVLWQKNNNLILCNTDSQSERKIAYVRSLLDKQIDGLILVSQSFTREEVSALDSLQMPPVVTINRFSDFIACDHVGLDNNSGISELMTHLLGLGHRKIAFIKGLGTSSTAKVRYEAYVAAMEATQLPVRGEHVVQGDYTMASGADAARQLLGLADRPTAIIAGNDAMAFGVLGALREKGVSVPEQMSVAGFDDIDMASHPLINLTTVRQPKRETGAAAAKLLLERIEGTEADAPQRTITLQPNLIIRGTTAAPYKS